MYLEFLIYKYTHRSLTSIKESLSKPLDNIIHDVSMMFLNRKKSIFILSFYTRFDIMKRMK